MLYKRQKGCSSSRDMILSLALGLCCFLSGLHAGGRNEQREIQTVEVDGSILPRLAREWLSRVLENGDLGMIVTFYLPEAHTHR